MNNLSLVYAVNRATLSGPSSKQHRIRQNAKFFANSLRQAGMGAKKWTNLSNKHFQRVADQMRSNGASDGRIAEVFSAARHLCRAYGNERISDRNDTFGVSRGSIANADSKAVSPDFVGKVIDGLENGPYEHGARCAAQIRLQYELGLRREESAKVDLVNDWNKTERTLCVQYGTKGGRPRTLCDLSDAQQEALEKALPFVSQSDRKGVFNLMPGNMGDEWLNRLDYAARKSGLTKNESGFTLHGNRHERFHQMYVDHTGFEPPNQFHSIAAFQAQANKVAGSSWPERDEEARDEIEVVAGHSAGRRDISNAYLGSSY